VGFNGSWYRCITTHGNNTTTPPSSPYWMPEHEPTSFDWNNTTTYAVGDMVQRNNNWYRCIDAHSNQQPPNVGYWVYVPAVTHTDLVYEKNALVYYFGNWYQWNGSSWS